MRTALVVVLALLGVIACSGPQAQHQHPDHTHASCFELVMGQGSSLNLAAISTEDVKRPTPSSPPPATNRRWSDATRWPGGVLPAEGENVFIPDGDNVLLDVSTPELGKLTIAGSLVLQDNGVGGEVIELTAAAIEIYGGMYVGSHQNPYRGQAIITVGNEDRAFTSECFSNNYIGLVHGKLEMYGDPAGQAWTRLSETAHRGSSVITVDNAEGWREGDRIAIASTDYFYPESWSVAEPRDRHIEVRTIVSRTGNRLTLNEDLRYDHYGTAQTYSHPGGHTVPVLETRAEVMRLDRNVTVRGPQASLTTDETDPAYRNGAHIKALGSSTVRLDSVELTAMGRYNELMRYPVHFHLQGEAAYGSFVRNSSLHHMYNRCITIHGSSGVLLKDNAAFDTYGHCYFFEDGAETRNVLDGNLGMGVRRPVAATSLIPTDSSHQGPSVFWVTNPDNVLINNVAASSGGSGFWYSLPEHPTGPSYSIFNGANVWPRQTPLGEFNNNLAHSNNNDGLHVDRGPAADLRPQTASYRPRSNPADRGSAPVTAYFDNFVAYKHKNAAAWFRGDFTELRGAMLADNAIGVTFASNNSGMTNSVVVMYSANVGTSHNSSTHPDGQPKVRSDDFAIRGFEFYDGTVYVRNTHFEGFKPETYRQAGALSILNHTAFSLSPANWAEGLTFSANTNRVRFEERTYEQREASYREHDSGSDGFASGTFLDANGSVTGTAGAYVTVRNPLLDQAGCQVRSEWNAFICTPTNGLGYASLSLRDTSGSELSVGPVGIHRSAVGASPSHTMFGTPNGGIHVPNVHFRTTVALGYQYHYEFTGQAPDKLTVEMREVQKGNSLLVSVPYSGPLFIYRDYWIDSRSFQDRKFSTLEELISSDQPGYYQGSVRLYMRLQVQNGRDYAHLTICRRQGC